MSTISTDIINHKKIQSLNALRFFMILIIVIKHFNLDFLTGFQKLLYTPFCVLTPFAVSFFFILSGFGMMLSNIQKDKSFKQPIPSLKQCFTYGINHVKNIYPIYIATIVLGLLFRIFTILYSNDYSFMLFFKEVVRFTINLFLLQSLTGMTYFTHAYNGVSWFLSSLFCIYLISPFLIYFFRKISKSIYINIISILFNIILLTIIALIGEYIESYVEKLSLTYKFIPSIKSFVYVSPFSRVFYVMTGMNIAIIFERIKTNKLLEKLNFTLLELIVLIFTITYYTCIYTLPINNNVIHIARNYFSDIVLTSIFIFIFAFDRGNFSILLSKTLPQILGNMSMYIFLIHFILFILVCNFAQSNIENFLYDLLAFILTLLLSYFLYRHKRINK